LAGAFEGAAVLVALLEVLVLSFFLTCFLCFFAFVTGAAGASVEGFGVVKRFIVLFLLVGRFICPRYDRRGLKLTGHEG
jgi:hypothetical protein